MKVMVSGLIVFALAVWMNKLTHFPFCGFPVHRKDDDQTDIAGR